MELDNPVLQSFEEGRLDHRSLATRLAPVSCSGDLLVGVLVHPPESLEGRPQLQDVEIVRHKVVNDGQLMVLLKETMEPQRERLGFRMHVSLQQFCRNICDQEKLKPRKRSHEDQSQSLGKASSPLPSASRPAGTNSPADLQQLSDSTDLMSVTCSTHKESTAAQKQLKKSAGMLCACLSDGVILHMQEIDLWLRISKPAIHLRCHRQGIDAVPLCSRA